MPEIDLTPRVAAPDFASDPYGYYTWHLTNHPQMYAEFRRRTDLYRASRPDVRVSADMICHVMRYYSGAHADDDQFKVNNVLTPLYARLYLHERPDALMKTRGSQLDALSNDEWTALLALVPGEETQEEHDGN